MVKDQIFFSYSRDDSEFALKLAKDLRANDISVWIDQLDIKAGAVWETSIEAALKESATMLLILSPTSVASTEVGNEVSYALDENNRIIPIMYKECEIPYRLRRLQFLDFTDDYLLGLDSLIQAFENDLKLVKLKSDEHSSKFDIVIPADHKKEDSGKRIKIEPIQKPTIRKSAKAKRKSKKPSILVYIFILLAAVVIYWFYFWPEDLPKEAIINSITDFFK